MWEKLTPADIERVKQALADRRRELEAEAQRHRPFSRPSRRLDKRRRLLL